MSDDKSNSALGRIGGLMGIAFAVLFVVGFAVLPSPSDNKDTAGWEKWWTDSGHRVGAVVGAYLMVLGLLAFVWFMWSLQRSVGGSSPMVIFGSLFVAMGMVSALARAAIPGGKLFGDNPIPAGDFSREFNNIGMAFLLVAGALAAGAFLALASHYARREALLPGWLTTAGFVVAALQLAAGFFVPLALFVLWVLACSIVLLRRNPSPRAVTSP